jgi:hypothetical protein
LPLTGLSTFPAPPTVEASIGDLALFENVASESPDRTAFFVTYLLGNPKLKMDERFGLKSTVEHEN